MHFIGRRLIARLPLERLLVEGETSRMRRTLGAFDLTMIGIGAIIGTGIFVLTGRAAAQHAGPALIISFIISAIASLTAAFSYSELASMIPMAGSAYTYTYTALGEFLAWTIGWDLILEYLVGAATVAVGWSYYLSEFFKDAFGYEMSTATTNAPLVWKNDGFVVEKGAYINIPALLIVLILTGLLVFGIRASATVNSVVVMIKLIVIIVFIFGAIQWVNKENYQPFFPERKDGKYGVAGIFKGAQTVFFAYIGFDAVSTGAQECRNPQRDLPIGICLSLLICTALYIAVTAVLLGLRPFADLDTKAPLVDALATHGSSTRWLRIMVEIGAVAGLTSVMLIMLMGQPRILYAMAKDGLMPRVFSRIHPRFKTPHIPTIVSGTICAVAAAFLPIDLLGDLTSVGTLLAFFLVNLSVPVLRYSHPNAHRGFRVPLGPYVVPFLGAIIAMLLIVMSGNSTGIRLVAWMGIGWIIYAIFGYRRSHLNNSHHIEELRGLIRTFENQPLSASADSASRTFELCVARSRLSIAAAIHRGTPSRYSIAAIHRGNPSQQSAAAVRRGFAKKLLAMYSKEASVDSPIRALATSSW
ncbi:amino acid transporter [Ramicandelaber brevisporus]|nr:amino acid transporter [Ramicandelaber brevisporus]